ncbi:MAG: DUF6660 family protein [Bacteroidota bacterium]
MRYLSFIVAVYMLALAITPCIEKDECAGNEVVCFHCDNSQNTQHHNETCNPLCLCNCCGGVTIVSNSDNILIAQIFSEELSVYTQNSPSEISFSIWQPPKVS